MSIESAKQVLSENSKVLYGIFGAIEASGYFPPRKFLNQFFESGSDPCDQDGRMGSWTPFELTEEEYEAVLKWWLEDRPDVSINDLGADNWNEWQSEIIEME
jgi:hypothetical protein